MLPRPPLGGDLPADRNRNFPGAPDAAPRVSDLDPTVWDCFLADEAPPEPEPGDFWIEDA